MNAHVCTTLVELSSLSSERGGNVRATFTRTIQVLQCDGACGDACPLVRIRVTSRERNLDGWVVRSMTEGGVTEQRLRFSMNNLYGRTNEEVYARQ